MRPSSSTGSGGGDTRGARRGRGGLRPGERGGGGPGSACGRPSSPGLWGIPSSPSSTSPIRQSARTYELRLVRPRARRPGPQGRRPARRDAPGRGLADGRREAAGRSGDRDRHASAGLAGAGGGPRALAGRRGTSPRTSSLHRARPEEIRSAVPLGSGRGSLPASDALAAVGTRHTGRARGGARRLRRRARGGRGSGGSLGPGRSGRT